MGSGENNEVAGTEGQMALPATNLPKRALLLVAGLILGYLTMFRGYDSPAYFYWDENYHVASAQKYLNAAFFSEPHPPLGKLLIAAGERLLDANPDDTQFIATNHAPDTPQGFSFAGYRFFPALLAAVTVPLFGLLAMQLSGSVLVGIIGAAAFGLDNALAVHLRGAMLEGPQLFFLVSAAVAAIANAPLLAGAAAGAAMATKINSAPVVALVLASLFFRFGIKRGCIGIAAALLLWAGVWQTHFALGQRLLEDKYKASAAYQTEVTAGNAGSVRLFLPALSEAMEFFSDYQRGVPTLNMCKGQENGSFPLLWPLGSQSINYRWERKNGETSYLYLQANPAVWLFSLLGFLWALRSWSLAPTKVSKEAVLLAVYLAGVLAPLLYDRVFYLYHFFIPLLAGVLAGGLALRDIARRSVRLGSISGAGLIAAFVATFLFFAPLTYYKPLTDPELKLRAWLPLWNLRCAGCESVFPIARPISGDAQRIAISGRKASSVTQGWGVTRMGLTDEEAPLVVGGRLYQFGIGTHANGTMVFSVPEWATRFVSFVGVPDAYKGRATSIQFSVSVDGKEGWRSSVLRPGDAPAVVDLPVRGGAVLKLGIHDAEDGITDDHGAWLEPIFK